MNSTTMSIESGANTLADGSQTMVTFNKSPEPQFVSPKHPDQNSRDDTSVSEILTVNGCKKDTELRQNEFYKLNDKMVQIEEKLIPIKSKINQIKNLTELGPVDFIELKDNRKKETNYSQKNENIENKMRERLYKILLDEYSDNEQEQKTGES